MDMHKILIFLFVLIVGFSYWTYKVVITYQAYQHAVLALTERPEIEREIGPYQLQYAWWLGIFRALRYGKIQEFEFQLNGRFDNAISVVRLIEDEGWNITCLNVVNGEYSNNRIIQDC